MERLSKLLERALSDQWSRFTTTYRIRHKHGRDFLVKGTFDPIWDTQGKLEKIGFVSERIGQE
ncbi:MAG: hypothetical protein ACLFUL_10915 [Desulfobacteraceae bacterium]